LNKIDLLEGPLGEKMVNNSVNLLNEEFPGCKIIAVSALQDIQPLVDAIGEFRPKFRYRCVYPPNHKFRTFCYESGSVENEHFFSDKWVLELATRNPKKGITQIRNRAKSLGIDIEIEKITNDS
jgi:hypothetical protein